MASIVKIDRKLRLVIELPREKSNLYVHSEALPTEVFESEFFDLIGPMTPVLARYGPSSPRYAALVLRQVAMAPLQQLADQPDAHARAKAAIEARIGALFNELHRLTHVVGVRSGRFDMLQLDDAKAAGEISEEECSRIDAALVHFTWGAQSGPADRESVETLLGALTLFGARTTSFTCSEFIQYCETLMKDGSTGASPESLPPSSTGSQGKVSQSSSNGSTSQNSPGARPPRTGIGITITRPQ